MNRTDEQIDAIVLARDIFIKRAADYNEWAKRKKSPYLDRLLAFGAAYEGAAAILTAALNEDWELLRNYEGA